MPELRLNVRHDVGGFSLRVNVRTPLGRLALFGPSGAGKSLLLDLMAGVRTLQQGVVALGDRVYVDTDRNLRTGPEHRGIGYLMQDAPLFPHLDVASNLTYSPRSDLGESRAREILSLLEIEPLLSRRPSSLSGGERRRVSLAQTLLTEPELLLLDEPVVGLNASLRARMLPKLRDLLQRYRSPVILVTHRPEVVQALCRTVVPIQRGKAGTLYSTSEFFHSERHRRDQTINSTNYFRARVTERRPASDLVTVRTEGDMEFVIPDRFDLSPEDPVVLEFPAEEPALGLDLEGRLSTRNRWQTRVQSIQSERQSCLVTLSHRGEHVWVRVTGKTVDEFALAEGSAVECLLKSQSIGVHPA